MSTLSLNHHRQPRALLALGVFIVVVIGVGALIGIGNVPGEWYEGLTKPPFNPPNWVFAPVWFVLYVLIAIAGWRTFVPPKNGIRMALWVGQMALNWAWSPVWFTAHALWPAFGIIVLMFAAIAGFIVTAWKPDRLSALLFIPYLLWVGFAALLNLAVALLN